MLWAVLSKMSDCSKYLFQASETADHRKYTAATISVAVAAVNNFDPVITTNLGTFNGQFSEDADAGTLLKNAQNQVLQAVITDQDLVGCLL